MTGWNRLIALLLLGLSVGPARGQVFELPAKFVPLQAPTQRELDHRKSLHLFTLGLLLERDDQLLEALRAYQESSKLEPQAAAPLKAQIPILVALDRRSDALAVSKMAVELNAEDHEAWFMRSRLLKTAGGTREAIGALQHALALPAIKDHPDMVQQMYFDLGVLHESLKDYETAAENLAKAAKLIESSDPEVSPFDREFLRLRAAETFERVGQLYLQAKNYDQALVAYRQAQKRFPDGAARLNLNLAQVCVAKARPADAIKYVDEYLRLQPQGLEAYTLKLDALKQLGKEGEIVPWLERASAADEFNVGLKMLLARQYAATKSPGKAEAAYLELAKRAPTPDLYRQLFHLYRDTPNLGLGKALSLLHQALDKDKAPSEASVTPVQAKAMVGALRDDTGLSKEIVKLAFQRIAESPEAKHEATYFLAALADRNRQLEEAEAFYRLSLRQATPNTEPIIYGGLLRVLWKSRKFQEIVTLCQEGLQNSTVTNRIVFHNDLARAYARLDKTAEALAEADKAVNLASDQDRLAVRHLRVRILAQTGQHEKALAECNAMLKEHTQPGDVLEIRYLLSNVYSSAKQQAKAEEQLQRILEIDPNSATANNDLGYMWADQGKNLPEAEAMIRKAIELDRRARQNRGAGNEDRDNAAYIDSLGWVLFRRGLVEEARKELEHAATLPDGDDPVIWDHLGDVYYRLALVTRAQSAWQRALQLYQQDRRHNEDRYRDLERKMQQVEQEVRARKE